MTMPAPPPSLSWLQQLRRSVRPLLTLVFLGGGGSLLLGLVALTAHRQGAFERQLQISLIVPDASGLHPGSRVTLSGVQVGALRELAVQPDGRVLLHFTVPEQFRGVVSPASVVSIGQDVLMGDRHLQVQAAPAPPASVPDRFQMRFGSAESLEALLRQASGSLRRIDALVLTADRLSDAELAPSLRQLRRSLQRADVVSTTLARELPPTAATLRGTGREAMLASAELVLTLRQLRPQLSSALRQVDVSAEEAQELLMWLNALIDKLDPLRRQAPAGTPARPSPSAPPPG
jgi:ABC-type transporter Mla subunit MlaD